MHCQDVRGTDLVQTYERSLRRADTASPVVKLFAGHRGIGKTSELLRLKGMLEQTRSQESPDRAFKVVYFDISQALDMNDLDFPDLLVFAAGELRKQLREADIPGFSTTAAYLQRVWDELKDLLGKKVTFEGAGVDTPYASLAVELKNRPNARRDLRAAIERQSTSLLGAVNDMLRRATVALRNSDHEGLVLIIDGLDKLVRRSLPDGTNTHDQLFLDRSEQLASLEAHVIYTVPISLIYSQRYTQLAQTFGEHNVPVPMIRLRPDDRGDPTPDTPGMKKMWEMVKARCKYAEVDIADVFDDPGTGHYLCQMTGGHPRHLMMFLQSAANAVDDLPITRDAAETAVNNYAVSLLREIPDEFWPKLKDFSEPKNDIPKDDDHLRMLFLLNVFEYMNSSPWYEVNPVLRTLAKFTQSD
ncbi:hypothetical protein H8E07_12785 [bacterium]|nr:hypothetical protein [bacterium]